MFASSLQRRCAVILLAGLIGGGIALAQSATKPTTEPATRPTAADKGGDETVAVARGSIDLRLDLDGVFAPLDPVEIAAKPKVYQGDFTVLKVAEAGLVKQGDVLLEIEPKLLKRQLALAEAELMNARANSDKAKGDFGLAANGDTLDMKRAKDQLRYADDAAKWWADNDSKMTSTMASVQDKIASFQTESAEDELDQLKKMYKSDDLTNETADIVMKRAVRILDIYKMMSQLSGFQSKKIREYMIEYNRYELASRVEQAKQAVAQLEINQRQAQVTRRTGVDAAVLAVVAAEDKLEDLKKDAGLFTVTAPTDGVLMYGSFKNKAWQPTPPEVLRVGEKLPPGQVVMTLVQPGRLRVVSELPETKILAVEPEVRVQVAPVAMPEVRYEGRRTRVDRIGMARGEFQAFDVWFELPPVNPELLPGMRATLMVPGDKVSDVLVVPVSAVTRNRVWVQSVDGKDDPRDVTIGRSDGKNVEIKAGLKEGEKVLKQAKK